MKSNDSSITRPDDERRRPDRPDRRGIRRRWSPEQRRLRFRRRRRRAYIRSVHLLPSLATLGNAVSGFAAIYISATGTTITWTTPYTLAAYFIFIAMAFDALDGRLARFARHTTDFGGQLDSLADVISFGAAPAFIALELFRQQIPSAELTGRLMWSVSVLFLCCAAIRLARFNVSNQHGEQHHFSFLGLPSPGAAGAVASLILMQQTLARTSHSILQFLGALCICVLPIVVLGTGLLMISGLRYPHIVNRYLRGRRSFARLLAGIVVLLLLVIKFQYTLGLGTLAYAAWGPVAWILSQIRRRKKPLAPAAPSTTQ